MSMIWAGGLHCFFSSGVDTHPVSLSVLELCDAHGLEILKMPAVSRLINDKRIKILTNSASLQ